MIRDIEKRIFDFFVESNDFNGIPLRQISIEFKINYDDSIDIIKKLVKENKVSIQSSTNPHIIGQYHYPADSQIKVLDMAKNTKVEYHKIGNIEFASEDTNYPICLYPSQEKLKISRNLEEFGYAYYSKQLALGEPQLKPFFFDIEVLERYFTDPRFEFKFADYSGSIYCKYDDFYNPLVREEDNIFIKTFGIGFDENNDRLAVVFLRYLHNLSDEHQLYWKGKERQGDCKVLEEYYQNNIEGRWVSSHSLFSAFLEELRCVNDLSKLIFNTNLFDNTFGNENRPKEFTFFFTPTTKNYHDFILLLDKMISENINKLFFKDKIDLFGIKEENGVYIKQNKGTLGLLEEWLTSVLDVEGDTSIKQIILPFKKIRKERQLPAHKISGNIYDKSLIIKQRTTMSEVYNSMRQLRQIFSLHEKASGYQIPNWLENGKIINL